MKALVRGLAGKPDGREGWPAIYRALHAHNPENWPGMENRRFFLVLRYADRLRRGVCPRTDRDMKVAPASLLEFDAWLKANPVALNWWHRPDSRLSPGEPAGWRDLWPVGSPVMEPWELANVRTPRSLVDDGDVLALQCWAAGMRCADLVEFMDFRGSAASAVLRGVEKVAADPYFQFMWAARHMKPFVLGFKQGPDHVVARMTELLGEPLLASRGELEVILKSPLFTTALEMACRLSRLKCKQVAHQRLPPGPSYHLYYVVENRPGTGKRIPADDKLEAAIARRLK